MRRVLRVALAALGGLGGAGVLVSFAVGPQAVRTFFGAHVSLPGPLLGALAIGTVALMATQVLQPTLVAVGRHRSATASWLLGSAVLTGLLFLPGDPLRAAVIAQLAGAVLVVAGMVAALSGALSDQRG
jgi:O-antigen/teichoic acid export membrane protein